MKFQKKEEIFGEKDKWQALILIVQTVRQTVKALKMTDIIWK